MTIVMRPAFGLRPVEWLLLPWGLARSARLNSGDSNETEQR